MSLTGKAREAALELEIEEIKHADGIKRILKWLDKLYLQDTNQSAYLAYQTFKKSKRPENMPMKEYVIQVVECSERTVLSWLAPVCLCWRCFGRYFSHHLAVGQQILCTSVGPV